MIYGCRPRPAPLRSRLDSIPSHGHVQIGYHALKRIIESIGKKGNKNNHEPCRNEVLQLHPHIGRNRYAHEPRSNHIATSTPPTNPTAHFLVGSTLRPSTRGDHLLQGFHRWCNLCRAGYHEVRRCSQNCHHFQMLDSWLDTWETWHRALQQTGRRGAGLRRRVRHSLRRRFQLRVYRAIRIHRTPGTGPFAPAMPHSGVPLWKIFVWNSCVDAPNSRCLRESQ